jgi:hypothetical protein
MYWKGQRYSTWLLDMSVSGARIDLPPALAIQLRDAEVTIDISEIGPIKAHVISAGGGLLHLRFDAAGARDAIITKLYTGSYDSVAHQANIGTALGGMFKRAFGWQ